MTRRADRLQPGQPYPLGATWDGLGVNFAVFSAHADKVELCLFDPTGRRETARLPLPECSEEVWHGYLPDAAPGLLYGLRAHGRYEPANGHRFNAHKLLLDPYAKKLSGEVRWSDALYGFRAGGPRADLTLDRHDSAAHMPKGVVIDDSFPWGDDRPPRTPWSETVIYEAHLRGLTMRAEHLPPDIRGTFAGLGHPATIEHLTKLGVTAVELLPVHAFVNDRFLIDRGLRNYWGYNTLGFFAPEPSYLSNGEPDEMKAAVRHLHAAGIEVILDVVYNHTAETDELGPTLSQRGLDNLCYYRLERGDMRRYVNDTGTGNTLNLSHPRVIQMVMDSLRHWVTNYHVDGFRFDLGVTLGREDHGFDPGCGFFDALKQDPVLSQVKLISEPWDIGPGGYQLGRHPPGFAEWNDKFRDNVRRFWRGDTGQRAELAARLSGSSDVFDSRARRPWASINYVASHDGFPLADVLAYGQKHNEANGEGNRDGHGDNCSANWGIEGLTEDAAIRQTRSRLQRAMLVTTFCAHGTPMLLAGDEFGRTQKGNNNAYCQDNDLSWLDWKLAHAPAGRDLTDFTARLIALRRAHPLLRASHFMHGDVEVLPGVPNVSWFDADGRPMQPHAWNDPSGRTLCLRRAARNDRGELDVLTLLLNATGADETFALPEPAMRSRVLIDSAKPDAQDIVVTNGEVRVSARSAVLVLSSPPPAVPR